MRLRKVAPKKIVVPEVRVTSQMDPEIEAMLKQSMATDGLIAPIICVEVEGQMVLVDGLHRLKEALEKGWDTVEVALVEGTMVDVLTRNLYLDHLRGKHSVIDMVRVIKALWTEYQLDSEKIAAKTGMTRDYVENLQLISELTPYCLLALEEGKLNVGKALALTKLKDPITQECACGIIIMHKWSVKDCQEYVQQVLDAQQPQQPPSPPPPPPPPTKVRCYYCGEEYVYTQIANPNTCSGCAGSLLQAIAVAKMELEKDKNSRTEDKNSAKEVTIVPEPTLPQP